MIFITETDIFGDNLPIYHVDRRFAETDRNFGDGAHIIYVNGACRDDSPLGRLMHDFMCKDPSDMYYKTLAEQVKYYKENQEGVHAMDRIMEEIIAEEIAEEKREAAVRLKKMGKFSDEDIAAGLLLTC